MINQFLKVFDCVLFVDVAQCYSYHSVSQSVHLYSALESRRNISTVPGGREQVLVQCTCEMKAFCDSSGARNAGGRLFQVVGPLTAKLCYPTAVTRTEQVEFDWMHSPYPPLDNIQVMLIVWRSRGNIVRTAPCWVV